MQAEAAIRARALALGFDGAGIAEAAVGEREQQRLDRFLAGGEHGEMAWMAITAARRRDPRALWPDARSVVMVAANYGPDSDPLADLARREHANISVYARNRDYHAVMKKRLRRLARWMAESFACQVKLFVDTAPLLEKPLAAAAGLGWQGKHSNLVSRDFGSWLFLGAVLTDRELAPDRPERDHCGRCRACLDICPTDAFPRPYQLDARRCISYLTIEHKGPIPAGFRPAIGNRIYGCDDCLAVCPWNKFARQTRELAFLPREDLRAPLLVDLLRLDDAGFRARFAGSPIKRIGRDRFLRNVLIALGNTGGDGDGDGGTARRVAALLGDSSALVRGAAVWALWRLLPDDEFAAIRERHLPWEGDESVQREWAAAG